MREILSYFFTDKAVYDRVKDYVWRDNWKGLQLFSALGSLAFAARAVMGEVFLCLDCELILYVVWFAVSLFFFAASYRKNISLLGKELLVYGFFVVLLFYGIVLGTLVFPETLSVSYIVLMIAVPLLFCVKACVVNVLALLSMVAYAIMAYLTQDFPVFKYNMLNIIPYGALSMLVTSAMMRSKLQKQWYRTEMDALAKSERESQERVRNHGSFITDMVRYASLEEEPDQIINQLLQYIGEKLHSDRAYIFEENSSGTFDNTYEWCKEGISKEIDHLQNVPYEGIIEIWYQQYRISNNIVIYDIEDYRKVSEAIYHVLKPQGVKTLVTGPIIIEGKMVGFYGVDNPPKALLEDISQLLYMMEFIVSFMMRLRNNARNLEYGALHDQLTNCKNRKAMEWLYAKEYREDEPLAVVMCDLNGLKAVNDKQGHDAGDRFILRTVEILKTIFGDEQVYRVGGDEFIVVMTNVAKTAFEEMVEAANIQLGTTASLGTVYRETMDTDFDSLLKIADAEMYEKKRKYYVSAGGKNT